MSALVSVGSLVKQGCISLQTGPFGSQLHSYDYADNGVPVIPTEGIKEGRIDHGVLPRISSSKAAELSRHRLQLDDILFARRGVQATGKTARIRAEEVGFICGTGAIRARVNASQDRLDAKYFSWVLAAPATVTWIKEQAIGATMPNLNEGIIQRLEMPLPPLPEQREIAGILGALDDKIEVNRKTSALLEEMARALYRCWFVSFDPVTAAAEGRPLAHLPPELAALFPTRFQDNGLPEGWRMGTISDVFDVVMGQSPPGETYNDNGVGLPFYQGRTDFGFRFPNLRKFCSAPTRLAPRDSTLLSVRAPVGDLNRAWDECCIGRGVASLQEKGGRNSYGYQLLLSRSEALRAFDSEGTVFGAINKKQLADIAIVLPPEALRTAFEQCINPLDDQLRVLTEESQTLAALRDSLLPRLMSGELRVGAARAQVEAVV